MDQLLDGTRVLSLEQAVALPFATRHLADLGAEVIRVQSHRRRAPPAEPDLTRNKLQLAIDLAATSGPETFLRVAAQCDVVAHNFTPRVVRRFGIDDAGVRARNPEVIYLSLTGFGTTGDWSERPLFGPGAEAFSGHNSLIGPPEADTPGRPGTRTYADHTCGLYALFATLAALEEREGSGMGQHIDVSLYETAVSHLGPVLSERAFGAERPGPCANEDPRYALHCVFAARGHDRHVSVSVASEQLGSVERALRIQVADTDTVAAAILELEAEAVVDALQSCGVAAAVVADPSDVASDPQLWSRGHFGLLHHKRGDRAGVHPHGGAAFGGGASLALRDSPDAGADNADVLSRVAGLSTAEIARLREAGVIGELAASAPRAGSASKDVRIRRGELSRVDGSFDAWREHSSAARR